MACCCTGPDVCSPALPSGLTAHYGAAFYWAMLLDTAFKFPADEGWSEHGILRLACMLLSWHVKSTWSSILKFTCSIVESRSGRASCLVIAAGERCTPALHRSGADTACPLCSGPVVLILLKSLLHCGSRTCRCADPTSRRDRSLTGATRTAQQGMAVQRHMHRHQGRCAGAASIMWQGLEAVPGWRLF